MSLTPQRSLSPEPLFAAVQPSSKILNLVIFVSEHCSKGASRCKTYHPVDPSAVLASATLLIYTTTGP
jgi:hypothetical protein